MKIVRLMITVFSLAFVSLAVAESPVPDASYFKPARYILLPGDIVSSLQDGTASWPKTGYWMPQQSQVDVFESEIRKAIAEPGSGLRPFDEYTIQYIGLTKQGAQLILANAFCFSPPQIDLKKQIYVVSGGGNCYFGALFEPNSSQLIGLSVNDGF